MAQQLLDRSQVPDGVKGDRGAPVAQRVTHSAAWQRPAHQLANMRGGP